MQILTFYLTHYRNYLHKNMKDITNYLEKNHVDIMVEAAAPATRDYLIIRMLWWTGMRVNELLHVRPVDLEPHTRMVRIEKA